MSTSITDDKYQRLKDLAHMRGQSINRLFDEVTTLMFAEFDAETRFKARAMRGSGKQERGKQLLAKAAS